MNRKEFIQITGGSCLALAGLSGMLSGCTSVHRITATPDNNQLKLSKQEFIPSGKERARELVLVRSPSLAFPIALYHRGEQEYVALWMECTHKGCEVNAQPDSLVCPCHGSEFNADGHVTMGPAERNLKTFNVTTDEQNIYIHL